MRPCCAGGLAAFLLSSSLCGAAIVEASSVHSLTDDDFESTVRGGREVPWFVKFYAPWCGHCKAFAPKWEELAKRMEGKMKFAAVDCMAAKQVAEDYDVTAFPTLKLISDGQVYKFTGKRTEDALEDFMTGGFRVLGAEPVPEDRPTSEKIYRKVSSFFWAYGFPFIGFLLVTGSFLYCWFGAEDYDTGSPVGSSTPSVVKNKDAAASAQGEQKSVAWDDDAGRGKARAEEEEEEEEEKDGSKARAEEEEEEGKDDGTSGGEEGEQAKRRTSEDPAVGVPAAIATTATTTTTTKEEGAEGTEKSLQEKKEE